MGARRAGWRVVVGLLVAVPVRAGDDGPVVVNYDDFQIDENVADDYWAMVKELGDKYYTHVSRYTTSAFMRLKLGEALEGRGLAAHIYETPQEAIDSARQPDDVTAA